jgi:hypothetical protein
MLSDKFKKLWLERTGEEWKPAPKIKLCIHRKKTNHKVKCKSCNAKYIYCEKKKLKINGNLCNEKDCDKFE